MMVTIDKPLPGVTAASLTRFAERARKAVRLQGKVTILVTSSREMRKLNRAFRGKDKPTDVLSFPAASELSSGIAGDIAISSDIAASNARRLGHKVAEELKVLTLHGMLHLAGFDHETDNGEMAEAEAELRRKLRISDGLIARSTPLRFQPRIGSKRASSKATRAKMRVR